MIITHGLIDTITRKDGNYFFPEWISIAVERKIQCDDVEEIKKEYQEKLFDVFQKYKKSLEPVPIGYTGALTLDAYTAFYFSRNFCIPLVGIRDLSFHPSFQNIPPTIQVLDLGSGTGAIVLGLLWLFSQKPLSSIKINITATDACEEALQRQRDIIGEAGLNLNNVNTCVADIRNTGHFIKMIEKSAPFDFIFSGNCLTETPEQDVYNVVQRLPEFLTDNGAIIIAEAQRNYSKMLIRNLIVKAPQWGLHVFYPCTRGNHPYQGEYGKFCMAWRDHVCKAPEMKINGSFLSGGSASVLTACWLILTKQNASIYDVFKNTHPDLNWGPVSLAYEDRSYNSRRAICSDGERIDLFDDGKLSQYKRGQVVGLTDEAKVLKHKDL